MIGWVVKPLISIKNQALVRVWDFFPRSSKRWPP
jgi:hypothetical protein